MIYRIDRKQEVNLMKHDNQMLLLVDEQDNFLGRYATRKDCHSKKGLHHRAFIVLLINDNGQVLLQKRKHELWDGYWDITATTHTLHLKDHDESYEEAAARCLSTEMGITHVSVKNIGGFNYYAKHGENCENEYCAVLIGTYRGVICPDPEVVYTYQWVEKAEFIRRCLRNDSSYTPWALLSGQLLASIPHHVAIIMDGNRRWAKERGLPIRIGHTNGYKKIETVTNYALSLGISYVTFWAFSTENWNREKKEIDALLAIFRVFFKSTWLKELGKKGVRICILGDLSRFPKDIRDNVLHVVESTKYNKAITVNIALNYGGRAELLRAVSLVLQSDRKTISEEEFSQYLYTASQPDPDLIIRTGGEKRLSGYLPWQAVYSELYFTDTFWPDFDEKSFDSALQEYIRRERRFGK